MFIKKNYQNTSKKMYLKTTVLILVLTTVISHVTSQSFYLDKIAFRLWGSDTYVKGFTADEVEKMREADRRHDKALIDREQDKYNNLTAVYDLIYQNVITKLLDGTDKVSDMHEKAFELVTSFINDHIEFAKKSATDYQEQVKKLHSNISNLVQKFINDHHELLEDANKSHQELQRKGMEINQKLVDSSMTRGQELLTSFRKTADKDQKRFSKLINDQIKEHHNMTSNFINNTQIITSNAIDRYLKVLHNNHREGNLVFYGTICGGIFLGVLLISLIAKFLFLGNHHTPITYPMHHNQVTAHPSTIRDNNVVMKYETVELDLLI